MFPKHISLCFLRQINSSIDKRVRGFTWLSLASSERYQQGAPFSSTREPADWKIIRRVSQLWLTPGWCHFVIIDTWIQRADKSFPQWNSAVFRSESSSGGKIPASAVFLLLSTLSAALYWCGGSITCCHTSGYLQQSSWCTLNVQIMNQSLNKSIITGICLFTFADRAPSSLRTSSLHWTQTRVDLMRSGFKKWNLNVLL